MIELLCLTIAVLAGSEPDSTQLDRALLLLDQLDAAPLTVDYRDERLQQILDDLNGRLPVPVRADWASLARLGVRPDDRVTLRVNPTRASTVLAGLALTLGEEFDRPMFEAHADQIVLTSIVGTAPMRLTGAYDVRDLLADETLLAQLRQQVEPPKPDEILERPQQTRKEQDDPPEPVDQAEPEGGPAEPEPDRDPPWPRPRAGRLPAPPIIDSPLANSDSSQPQTPGEQLFMIITDHVDPDAWINFGGDRARISDIDGVLMITASPTVHRKFLEALEILRTANPTSLGIDAAILDLPRATHDRMIRHHTSNFTSSAASILNAENAEVLWQTTAPVALGAKLDVESSSPDTQVRVALEPTIAKSSGTLNIVVVASTVHGPDKRSIATTVALHGDQEGAIIELPAAEPSDMLRLLVLIPRRK